MGREPIELDKEELELLRVRSAMAESIEVTPAEIVRDLLLTIDVRDKTIKHLSDRLRGLVTALRQAEYGDTEDAYRVIQELFDKMQWLKETDG